MTKEMTDYLSEPTEDTPSAPMSEEKVKLVYIGPTIHRSMLRNAMVLSGTGAEIAAFIDPLKAVYPEIEYLLVPTEKLAQTLRKMRQKGNILTKYYHDMAAKAKANRSRRE